MGSSGYPAPTSVHPGGAYARLGAHLGHSGTEFLVWSTTASRVFVEVQEPGSSVPRRERLEPLGADRFGGLVADAGEGARYRFVLDDRVTPDPYALWLPEGVHGPAEVIQTAFAWTSLRPSRRTDVIYELHVGTFTPEGTWRAASRRLPELLDLGVDTIEVMPISSFPGGRGWGYDGVAHFAPYAGYGKPRDLQRFVDAAHRLGLRVILDVVYNHFGPDGNYLAAYSPEYFSSENPTPWGAGPNFRNEYMRALVVNNASFWISEYGFDGLRLDALHAIHDPSPVPIFEEIVRAVRSLYADATVIAEDEHNQARLVLRHGMNAIWADDFHHQVSVLLTGERDGYYESFQPNVADLAQTIEAGWLYQGQMDPFSGQPRGTPTQGMARDAFVYCLENHDQIGNRAFGERLSFRSGDTYAAATMLLLFLPYRPLLFMGQEWAASTPFLYFTDHEPKLGRAVTQGRRAEFRKFEAFRHPEMAERIPDPQAPETFLRSKLRWEERAREPHASMLRTYRTLLYLRKSDFVLSVPDGELVAHARGDLLVVSRTRQGQARRLYWNLGRSRIQVRYGESEDDRKWQLIVASTAGWALSPRQPAQVRKASAVSPSNEASAVSPSNEASAVSPSNEASAVSPPNEASAVSPLVGGASDSEPLLDLAPGQAAVVAAPDPRCAHGGG